MPHPFRVRATLDSPRSTTSQAESVSPAYISPRVLKPLCLKPASITYRSRHPREVNVSTLFGKAHARVRLPTDLLIADLRDASLRTLGIERSAVASSPREHYPCARRVAKHIHSSMQDVAGIVWHSRQAEINQQPAAKVLIVFADRVPTERGDWQLVPDRSSFGALLEGSGWLLVDRLADSLGVTLVDELS